MAIKDTLDTLYLCWFSQPKADRVLYRCVRQQQIQSIVEVGIASTERTLRLLRLARRMKPDAELHYAGIDLFEARPSDQPSLKLKGVHQLLAHQGATIRLVPGDPLSALARTANQLVGTQLLIVGNHVDEAAMAQAWTYIPRILATDATVLVAEGSGAVSGYRQLTAAEIEQRVTQAAKNRRLAA